MSKNKRVYSADFPTDDQIKLIRALNCYYSKQLTQKAIMLIMNQNKKPDKKFTNLDIDNIISGAEGTRRWLKPSSREFAAIYVAEFFLKQADVQCKGVINYLKAETMKKFKEAYKNKTDYREWDRNIEEDYGDEDEEFTPD